MQNRCFARAGWDREVRAFCRERGIVYQGFSLLTANLATCAPAFASWCAGRPDARAGGVRLRARGGHAAPHRHHRPAHMREDLGAYDVTFGAEDVRRIENIALQ